MARIELAPEVGDDFDRILDHLADLRVEDASRRAGAVISALDVLEQNPLIGRPAGRGLQELIIGRRATSYLALYRYLPEVDMVLVLAIRSQREAGYSGAREDD